MNCTDININIDRFLERELVSDDLIAFKQHIATCNECSAKLQAAQFILSGLQQLPVPPPSVDFEQRVFAEVRKQHKETQPQHHAFRFATGFATAALASLAIWLVSSTYFPDTIIEQPQVISVAMNQAQTVRLMFDSESDIERVNLSIDLPHNMQLEGYPGRNELSWQTRLQKGHNVLALPIMAIEAGQGELLARLSYGDKVKTLLIVLKTTVDGAQRYQLDEAKST